MKTIKEILSYEPQIAKEECGTEPCLGSILFNYYVDHRIDPFEAERLARKYADKLEEFVK